MESKLKIPQIVFCLGDFFRLSARAVRDDCYIVGCKLIMKEIHVFKYFQNIFKLRLRYLTRYFSHVRWLECRVSGGGSCS